MLIEEIPRNDTAAALRYVDEQMDAGTFTRDKGGILVRLFDDIPAWAEAMGKLQEERRAAGKPAEILDHDPDDDQEDDESEDAA
ncbi:MAG TPA: hypothetical protein VIM73_22475 [Polyangiaceae bacterium]